MGATTRETPRPHRATYQDVIDAPTHRGAEIVDGALYVSPRPGSLATLAKTNLFCKAPSRPPQALP